MTIDRPVKGYPRGGDIWRRRGSDTSKGGKHSGPSGYQTKHYLGSLFASLYAAWKARGGRASQ